MLLLILPCNFVQLVQRSTQLLKKRDSFISLTVLKINDEHKIINLYNDQCKSPEYISIPKYTWYYSRIRCIVV